MKPFLLWLRIIRPQTLPASLVPVLVAVLLTARHGIAANAVTATLTALCALALQILSNLINDYYDFRRGTDREGRAGFRRALAEGEVSERQMLAACGVAAATACALGLPLVLTGGLPILLIGLTALLFAWLYTATRHSLSYLGIADIFVLLYYGVLASSGTAWLLVATGHAPGLLLSIEDNGALCREHGILLQAAAAAGAVSGLVSMMVLMINNLRDRHSDRLAGKRTLPVRFGKRAGETLMLAEALLMPLCAWLAFHTVAPMLVVVPALLLWRKVRKANGAEYNRCLVMAGMTNVVYLLLCLT